MAKFLGLFGGGGGNPYTGQLTGQVSRLNGLANQYGGMASQAGADYNAYRPQFQNALSTYGGLLGRNATDSDKAGYVSQLTAPVQRNFLAGQAGLSQNLAQRGLSPDSSVGAGAQAILEGQRAAALGNASSQASQYFDQRQLGNAGELQGLYGGLMNGAFGQQTGLLGAQQGALQAGLGPLQGLQQQQEEENQAGLNALYGLLGQGASYLGGMYGSGGTPKPYNGSRFSYKPTPEAGFQFPGR